MDIVPCNEKARDSLISSLSELDKYGRNDMTNINYVARTFPSILVDIVRHLSSEALKEAKSIWFNTTDMNTKENIDKSAIDSNISKAIQKQLKPFFIFHFLLGKCPQVTAFIYNYFEQSQFQPLPTGLFKITDEGNLEYINSSLDDQLVMNILISYSKYLAFDSKRFSLLWNWGELARLAFQHPLADISYLAASCLSMISLPSRIQHISFMKSIVGKKTNLLSDLHYRMRFIYENDFKPCIETRLESAIEFATHLGLSDKGYPYCKESIAKISNILLMKKRSSIDDNRRLKQLCDDFIPVGHLDEVLSRIAYNISINKPCFLIGECGSGKTSIIDHIAAKVGRIDPPDYLKIQVGDQLDSKMLIGSYVCTNIPGQFEWQAGPLTRAMLQGSWIVFEDINLAPSDVLQVINSVVDNNNLTCIPNCPIKLESPHPDFRIFFTQRTESKEENPYKTSLVSIDSCNDSVHLSGYNNVDLARLVKEKYDFGSLTDLVIKLYTESINIVDANDNRKNVRTITTRDLFKLCDRLKKAKIPVDSIKLETGNIEILLCFVVDCFLNFLCKDEMISAIHKIGEVLQLASKQSEKIVFNKKSPPRISSSYVEIGNIKHKINSHTSTHIKFNANTSQSLNLLSKLSVCLDSREPVLLVGETGVGKTAIVQHLADLVKTKLVVINLSQQSDSSDLIGGFKPTALTSIMQPLCDEVESLLECTFNQNKSLKFQRHLAASFVRAKSQSDWNTFLKLVIRFCTGSFKKDITETIKEKWSSLMIKTKLILEDMKDPDSKAAMSMSFVEGYLIKAVKDGHWILLDEINLAETDVLQCLLQILDNQHAGNLYISDMSSEVKKVSVHTNFRLFACMNPATDIGKKNLSTGVRSRFTEFFVNDVTDVQDLILIAESYVKNMFSPIRINELIKFYLEMKKLSPELRDFDGRIPVYNLRTLCRALSICSNDLCKDQEKTLYESILLAFVEQLDQKSSFKVIQLMDKSIFPNKVRLLESKKISKPSSSNDFTEVEGFWLHGTSKAKTVDESYILTQSIKKNLKSVARIVSLAQSRLPILIQGNTSVGKTSLISYLAKISGNHCVRINNHEHTDLEEYVGRYIIDSRGGLNFCEGILVKAMKNGHWIILDELNLAPSDLLEALNRVLDDNRELNIPEIKETVKAHPNFTVFATQNPPNTYSGRKQLSRAFRNRFIEISFDEIPHDELETILHKRCEMPTSYSKKIIAVMKKLQMMRRETDCFHGKSGFMTLRDVFRWGDRYLAFKKTVADNDYFDWECLASYGLILLEGRVKTSQEADTVMATINEVFNINLDRSKIYSQSFDDILKQFNINDIHQIFGKAVFNEEFKKMFVQLTTALRHSEPVLLCGPTGCGKTTAVQYYSLMSKIPLVIYNCHQNSESADFIGSVRPNRGEDSNQGLFSWVDGPITESMKEGKLFLMDEISLADDAVLERLNSVLEPSRSITITENIGEDIVSHKSFRFIATMNPGGDFGKKELSTALRNRLTEIYCHEISDIDQVMDHVKVNLPEEIRDSDMKLYEHVMSIIKDFIQQFYSVVGRYDLRSIIKLTDFLSKTTTSNSAFPLSIQEALYNGVSLVYFDQFGTCGFNSCLVNSVRDWTIIKVRLLKKLKKEISEMLGTIPHYISLEAAQLTKDLVRINKFTLEHGPYKIDHRNLGSFAFNVPSVKKNLIRIARAMQLDRPILLEGDPGVGKTSIVSSLAKLTGHRLVRFNLSESTDVSDMFGSDLPDDTDKWTKKPKFSWHDGPILKALKNSDWILLDELNLASQSILESLNACFDHRSEIYIPELSKTFKIDRTTTRIFATQNPYSQGSSRKGLPQSFLNRFISLYIESHSSSDLELILTSLSPQIQPDIIQKMVKFNQNLKDLSNKKLLSRSSSCDYNLRDLSYWIELMTCSEKNHSVSTYQPERFVQFVYLDRLRDSSDRDLIIGLFEKIFGLAPYEPPFRELRFGESSILLGRALITRKTKLPPHLSDLCILKFQLPIIESMMVAVCHNKMPILVGQKGTGKRSMVKILSGITGNRLIIISANSEMDTIELLGSFDQKSITKELSELVEKTKFYVFDLFNAYSKKDSPIWINICYKLWTLMSIHNQNKDRLSGSRVFESIKLSIITLRDLIDLLKLLTFPNKVNRCLSAISNKLESIHEHVNINKAFTPSGCFKWSDSNLVQAIKQGFWVLIENANLMNPATLDRLNSLVEPDGYLYLSEKGADIQGNVELIKPHPDFRLFLTMDPKYGDLSRAMKNRGVEIYVDPLFYYEDFLILLHQSGYAPVADHSCMAYCIMQTCIDINKKITSEPDGGPLLTHFALNYTSILTHSVRRGRDVAEILYLILKTHYTQNNFPNELFGDDTRLYIEKLLSDYRKIYKVSLNDSRYLWVDFKYDLFELSGGQALISMLQRDEKILHHFCDVEQSGILKPEEMIENVEFVIMCTCIKLFLEHSTHDDLGYRIKILQECNEEKVRECIDKLIITNSQYLLKLNDSLSNYKLKSIKASEFYIDTRNCPDLHYHLKTIDLEKTNQIELAQNRWILSNYATMLMMISELNIKHTDMVANYDSLLKQGGRYRDGMIDKRDLIRPCAEIVPNLAILLERILLEICNRCLSDEKTERMLPRIFWINHFLCKLQTAYPETELVHVCNQLPATWSLTYQKIICPIMKECKLQDIKYREAKLSNNLRDICKFFNTSRNRFNTIEKERYRLLNNVFASTTISTDILKKSLMKIFSNLLSKALALPEDTGKTINQTISTLHTSWTKSKTMKNIYRLIEKIVQVESEIIPIGSEYDKHIDYTTDCLKAVSTEIETFLSANNIMLNKISESVGYGLDFLEESKCTIAQAQFSLIWQSCLIMNHLTSFSFEEPDKFCEFITRELKLVIDKITGILTSPRFYHAALKCSTLLTSFNNDNSESKFLSPLETLNIYYYFVSDLMAEKRLYDNQVVGWTKMLHIINDIPPQAPNFPDFCPLISYICSQCLDIRHLKVNSYSPESLQVKTFLLYCWRRYYEVKKFKMSSRLDFGIVYNILHLRRKAGIETDSSNLIDENYLDKFIGNKIPEFEQLKECLKEMKVNDSSIIIDSFKMICFGYLMSCENSPSFSIDPVLRTREKLDIYRSELAHIKLELYLKNILFYWKSGENLRLNETLSRDDIINYPFSHRVLFNRRLKLEDRIASLKKKYTFRPFNDDGSQYQELKSEIDYILINQNNAIFQTLKEFKEIFESPQVRYDRVLRKLYVRLELITRNLEKCIINLRSRFSLYSDLTTNFMAGLSIEYQGLKCLCCLLDRQIDLIKIKFYGSYDEFVNKIERYYSINNYRIPILKALELKIELFDNFDRLCPTCGPIELYSTRSKIILSVFNQLSSHISMSPTNLQSALIIMKKLVKTFYGAWFENKKLIEEKKQRKEELYQLKSKTSHVLIETSPEHHQTLDTYLNFPSYEYCFKDYLIHNLTTIEIDNLKLEEKLTNVVRELDLTLCLDICNAHMKFIRSSVCLDTMFHIGLSDLSDKDLFTVESEILYTMLRHGIRSSGPEIDSIFLESHMLKALDLLTSGRIGAADIDVYHQPYPCETIKLQTLCNRIAARISALRAIIAKSFEDHPILKQISILISRLGSFPIEDPLMKFITGSQTLLDLLESWNRLPLAADDKLLNERTDLVELISAWRMMELQSWAGCLKRVEDKFRNEAVVDLWFQIYELFNSPTRFAIKFLESKDYEVEKPEVDTIYSALIWFIKNFFESSTIGDYHVRLDIVLSFLIQSSLTQRSNILNQQDGDLLDLNILNNCIFNVFKLYHEMYSFVATMQQKQNQELSKKILEQKAIVSWRDRSYHDIRTSFKKSYKQLSRIMMQHEEFLKNPIPLNDLLTVDSEIPKLLIDSEQIGATICSIHLLIANTCDINLQTSGIKTLKNRLEKIKEVNQEMGKTMAMTYSENLISLESVLVSNNDHISNFYSHNVQEIIINNRDSDLVKQEKTKSCKAMYHSKRFSLNSILSNLESVGLSYKRGNNSISMIDKTFYHSRPMRDLSETYMNFHSESSEYDGILNDCASKYHQLIAANMLLHSTDIKNATNVDRETIIKMRGISLDFILMLTSQQDGTSVIHRCYRSLNDFIELARSVLDDHPASCVYTLSYPNMKLYVGKLHDLIERSLLILKKLSKLMQCRKFVCSEQLTQMDTYVSESGEEHDLLKNLIENANQASIFIDDESFHILSERVPIVIESLQSINIELLHYDHKDIDNYVFTNIVKTKLELLLQKYRDCMETLILRSTQDQGVDDIFFQIEYCIKESKQIPIDIEPTINHQPCITNPKLELRKRKTIISSMIGIQNMYKYEQKIQSDDSSSKKVLYADAKVLVENLSPNEVCQNIRKCLLTMNNNPGTDAKYIFSSLFPIIQVYLQDLSLYLCVASAFLHVKLSAATQCLKVFIDISRNGLGLPIKISNENSESCQGKASKSDEPENRGFGQGDGNEDVTDRIEHESELDGLKNEEKESNNEATKDVDANDAGVEMSEVEGGFQKDETEQDQEQSKADVNNQEEVKDMEDDLDNQIDEVDKNENMLDEKIWGEKQEEFPEDDESDLRECIETKNTVESNQKTNDALKEFDRNLEVDEDKCPPETQVSDQDTTEVDDQNFVSDLDSTADQFDDESKTDISESESKESKQNNIDMEISDDESNHIEDESESVVMEEGEKMESERGSPPHNSKSDETQEEEIEQSKPDETGETVEPSVDLNDEFIDRKLERMFEPENPTIDNFPQNELDITENIPAGDSEQNQTAPTINYSTRRLGRITVFDMMQDDQDNFLDEDVNQNEDLETTEADTTMRTSPNNENKENSKHQDDLNSSCKPLIKRTLASEISEPDLQPKRPKIIKDDQSKPSLESSSKESDEYQHVEQDKLNTVEMIDLADEDVIESNLDTSEPINKGLDPKTSSDKGLDQFDEKASSIKEPTYDHPSQQDDAIDDTDDAFYSPISPTSFQDCIDEKISEDELNERITNYGLLKFLSKKTRFHSEEKTMLDLDTILGSGKVSDVDRKKLTSIWMTIAKQIDHLTTELCYQLQIVLQPTKMSKYKGDYKTGKRLNMRKIINYIASHYRKDKIWLRRTKPNKKNYHIALAIDNSSSMNENNCRHMTFQTLALLAKSFTLIDAGSMGVISFGQNSRLIHDFTSTYTIDIGANWLQELSFNEPRTSYTKMLNFSFEKLNLMSTTSISSNVTSTQLLIIISDGRNFSKEESSIRDSLIRLQSQNVMVLFIIIDNLKGSNSIMNMKKVIDLDGGNVRMTDYMDGFPFPFYIILRDIDSMPTIIAEAIRQWFELSSN